MKCFKEKNNNITKPHGNIQKVRPIQMPVQVTNKALTSLNADSGKTALLKIILSWQVNWLKNCEENLCTFIENGANKLESKLLQEVWLSQKYDYANYPDYIAVSEVEKVVTEPGSQFVEIQYKLPLVQYPKVPNVEDLWKKGRLVVTTVERNGSIAECVGFILPLEKSSGAELTIRMLVQKTQVTMNAIFVQVNYKFSRVNERTLTLFDLLNDPVKYLMVQKSSIPSGSIYKGLDTLDETQLSILMEITIRIRHEQMPHLFLIHGETCTGKSHLLSNLIIHILRDFHLDKSGTRILVCTTTSPTLDSLMEKMIKLRPATEPGILRMVYYTTVDGHDQNIYRFTVKSLVQCCIEREINRSFESISDDAPLKVQYYELYEEFMDLSRLCMEPDCLPEEKEHAYYRMKALKTEMHQIKLRIHQLLYGEQVLDYECLKRKHLNGANLVFSTFYELKNMNEPSVFDICIVDNATQLNENALSLLLRFGVQNIILAGNKTHSSGNTFFDQKYRQYFYTGQWNMILKKTFGGK